MDEILRSQKLITDKCFGTIVDTIESKILEFYTTIWDEISEETIPNFGVANEFEPSYLIRIIEELIRRKKLRYEHLMVLLPRETKRLTCDEDTKFSPFQIDMIRLISKRCPSFEILHYHQKESDSYMLYTSKILRASIIRLKCLKEINLYDSTIENETMRIITKCCCQLTELNLLMTNVSDEGLSYLHDNESVIRYSLTTLIIDETNVSAQAAGKCLLMIQSLTHFQFDITIETCLLLFEHAKKKTGELVLDFNTTIFKSRMNAVTGKPLVITHEFQQWLIRVFPKVEHLILISITENEIPIVGNLIRSWKNISRLELSAPNFHLNERFSPNVLTHEDIFAKLKTTFEVCNENLIALKLERFRNVDILYLGKTFFKLEKLTLINNWISSTHSFSRFRNLKEFEIVYLYSRNYFIYKDSDKIEPLWDLSVDDWRSLFSSENLQKVFIYNQYNFKSSFLENLLLKGYLRNLKELKVFYCPLKLDGIIKLFCEGIPVEKIEVGFCPFMRFHDSNLISTFIKDNYGATFSVTKEIPYLRWLVLDSVVN